MYREQSRQTQTSLAKSAEITKSTLSKIENGQISSTVSTLTRIAKAMGRPLSDFFAEPPTKTAYVFTPAGEGEIVTRGGTEIGHVYEGLALSMTGKATQPYLMTIHPGDPPGRFKHGGEEFFYVLSGRMVASVGDKFFEMGPGDSLYFYSENVHSAKAVGDIPVRFLCIYADN